jgi:atypical dual specificity phosphatase
MTPDDVVIDAPVAVPGHVVITEKLDGANMGFSLSSDRSRIVIQNRSHYVNPATHEQFKKLGLWIGRHRKDLDTVLDRDEYFAERYVLFGEWMYATHSIPYTRLPGQFVAFDLYDRSTEMWADRRSLENLLRPTDIPLVPVLREGEHMPSDRELIDLVQTQSRFWDGRVEGVYIKVERDGKVAARGKVVRGDFIAGNEHWTRGPLRRNGMESEYRAD